MRYLQIVLLILGIGVTGCLEQVYAGVVRNIASDRKMEKIGGISEPEGLDKYIKRRMDALDSALAELAEKIGGAPESGGSSGSKELDGELIKRLDAIDKYLGVLDKRLTTANRKTAHLLQVIKEKLNDLSRGEPASL